MPEQPKELSNSAEDHPAQERIQRLESIVYKTELISWLEVIKNVEVPGGYIVGGALRNTVWKYMFPDSELEVNDVDIPYYSPDLPPEADREFDQRLKSIYPTARWQCANQALVHLKRRRDEEQWVMTNAPYSSLEHSMVDFWFSVNRIGIRLDGKGKLEVLNPNDLEDLFNGILRVLPNQIDNPYKWFEDKISKITSRCPQIKVIR